MSRPPVQDTPKGAVLSIHVQPKASKAEYAGLHGGALKFRVAAPPVEGAANEALCTYLAERFRLSKKAVVVKSGQSSRHKRVLLMGVTASQVRAWLASPSS
jgi:uncharacterized protein (TIGR00251 family)